MEEKNLKSKYCAGTAILFIHGILGTPEQFRDFIGLIPEWWDIVNLTLKGHCGTVKDFSRASMTEWKCQVHSTLNKLRASHEKVYIAAHSMGTLLAIQEAVREPVDGLFLMNVPLKIAITKNLIKTCAKVYSGRIMEDDLWGNAAKEAYGISPDRNPLHYVGWVPRYIELFSEIRKTNRRLEQLNTPCYVYLSAHDEMVSVKTEKILNEKTEASVKILKDSGHFYYYPKDKAMLLEDFRKYIVDKNE